MYPLLSLLTCSVRQFGFGTRLVLLTGLKIHAVRSERPIASLRLTAKMRDDDSRQLFLGKSHIVWGDVRVGSFPTHCLAPPEWDQAAGTFSAIVVCSIAFGLIVTNSGWQGGVGE